MALHMIIITMLLLTEICDCHSINQRNDDTEISINMPGVHPNSDDEYWCFSYQVSDGAKYVTQFEAMAEGSIAHHILVYGCQDPAYTGKSWQCMHNNLCSRYSTPSKILFAWARNAPPTRMPKDVGYKIGGDSEVNYIVLQIHYARKFTAEEAPDTSGMKLTVTETPQKYKAGVLLMLSTHLLIPAHAKNIHSNMSCRYNGDTDIHPFAFRTHAHSLATVITGYKYSGGDFHLLGKGNPQWPQAFYPMSEIKTVKHEDYLVAQCTYDATNSNKNTKIGSTHNDEMCNFYMMYYTQDLQGDSFLECYDDERPDLSKHMPADSDVPPPRNLELEEMGDGHSHHKHMEGEGEKEEEQEPIHANTDLSMQGQYSQLTPMARYSRRGGPPSKGINSRNNVRGGAALPFYDNSRYAAPQDDEYPNPYDTYEDYNNGNGNYLKDFYVQNQRSRNRRPLTGAQQSQQNRGGSSSDRRQSVMNGGLMNRGNGAADVGSNTRSSSGMQGSNSNNNVGGEKGVGADSNNQFHWQGSGFRKTGAHSVVGGGMKNYNNHANVNSNTNAKSSLSSSNSARNSNNGGGSLSSVTPSSATTSKPKASAQKDESTSTNNRKSSSVKVVESWPAIQSADNLVLGQVGGVATDSKGNVHIFHRGTREWDSRSFNAANEFLGHSPIAENTLITFDSTGKVIDQWGKDMFYMPHGLYFDDQDNMWVTDVAMHQVMRFPAGKKEADIVLGMKLKRGTDHEHFCKPTDVTVLPTGEFFVADGYCNHRIVKFSKDGTYIKEWGTASKSVGEDGFPPPSTFDLPHSLVNIPNHDRLCVADRENGRIQCFDYEGKFIKQIHIPEFGGRLFALTYCQDFDVIYAVNGEQTYAETSKVSGFTINYSTGALIESWGPGTQEFKRPHDITVANKGKDLYVGEIGPNQIWKFSVDTSKYSAHKSVKRPGSESNSASQPPPLPHHPQSVDSSSDDITMEKIEKSEEPDFGVSIVIGALLIVPVLVIIIIVVFLRVRKRFHFNLFSLSDYKQKNRRFNLGEFFGRHKGFDPVATDDNGELDHLNSDSDDVEEYSATSSHKA